MMRDNFDFSALEPDIVTVILQKVVAMAPEFSASLAAQVEAQVRAEFGGQRVFVPKVGKRMAPQQRQELFNDGLTSMTQAEILEKHKVSRSTLYRVMKGGGGRFS
jgi:Mor family transcriptional regulator